jgi:hypothetical protein
VSHQKERSEKICLNCGTEVAGRFCQVCGQENVEPKETFWHLVTHFFNDITHFDGKFFTTVGLLVRRPGFLSKEYMVGRRMRYLNPIRMYVFTSFVFFLIFFNVVNVRNMDLGMNDPVSTDSSSSTAAKVTDSIWNDLERDSVINRNRVKIGGIEASDYKSREEYDSIQASLPKDKRDGWLKTRMTYRSIKMNQRYNGNSGEMVRVLLDKFFHTFPYLLFVSLPLFALYLKLLYWGRRKEYYFTDHGIFLVHLYIFTFLYLLLLLGLIKLSGYTDWGIFDWIITIFLIYGIYHAYKSMKNFYGQGRRKTLLKFFVFNIVCFFSLILLFMVFLTLTFFQV